MTWVCECGATGIRFFDATKRLHIYGNAYLYGQPYEQVACRACGDRWRFIELVWSDDPVPTPKQARRVIRRTS